MRRCESADRQKLRRTACALDLGSKTFKAVIGDVVDGTVSTRLLAKRAVCLGAEVVTNQGVIGEAKLAEVRQTLADLRETCERQRGEIILAVATRAARSAANGAALLDVARDAGIAMEVADGEREGELAYLAVTRGAARKLVCDFGSQSMQLAWRTGSAIEAHSLNVGYEQAHADFFRHARRFGQARETYQQFLLEQVPTLPSDVDQLICLAMNTVASFVTDKPKAQITNRPLTRSAIRAKSRELDALSAREFASLKFNTPKIDKILPGLALLDQLLARSGFAEGLITETEMAAGLIVEYFDSPGLA